MQESQNKSPDLRCRLGQLYLRLGGEPQLEKILKAFYAAMASDVMIGYFFTGKDLDHIVSQQKNFLMRAMGAHQEYHGKSPSAAHAHLPQIRGGHFDRRLVILRETLERFKLGPEDIQTWINYEESFRGVVTGKGRD